MMLSAMPMLARSPLGLLAREPIKRRFAGLPAWLSAAVLATGDDRSQCAPDGAECQRGGDPDPGGLARGAEIADLPAPLAGQVTQVVVGVDRDGSADQRQHLHVVEAVGVSGAALEVEP